MDVEPFNLDILLKETLNKCRKALKGEMNSVMAGNISSHLKNSIIEENKKIANYIIEKITLDFVENYDINSDFLFKNYIVDNFFGKSIKYFLDKKIMNESCANVINESTIIEKYGGYIWFSKNKCNEIIKNDLKRIAYDFLDCQAIKEKETEKNILNHNRRTHKDFIETSKNFLINNFNYKAQILFIKYLINQNYFINDIKKNLDIIIENILAQNDIKKLISKCFLKKFEQFENEIKIKTPELMNNANKSFNKKDINEREENDSSSQKEKETNNNNEDNLPPPSGVLEYHDESQIKEKKIKKINQICSSNHIATVKQSQPSEKNEIKESSNASENNYHYEDNESKNKFEDDE